MNSPEPNGDTHANGPEPAAVKVAGKLTADSAMIDTQGPPALSGTFELPPEIKEVRSRQNRRVVAVSLTLLTLAIGGPLLLRSVQNSGTISTAIPPGLVAWWPLDGDARDANVNHNGRLSGTFTFGPAKVGTGIFLDGPHSGIEVPDSSELNFREGADLSIEAWIQPNTTDTMYGVEDIVDKREAPNLTQSHGYALALSNGKLSFQMSQGLSTPLLNFIENGPDLRDGNWHHVAVSVRRESQNGGNLYVDGENAGRFDPTGVPGDLTTARPLLIGMHASFPWFQGNFNGGIDEVSIYRRALSGKEVRDIFRAGQNGKGNRRVIAER